MKKAMDDSSSDIAFLDVREYDEVEIAKIEGVPLIPLGELPQRFMELDPNQTIYIHCKVGAFVEGGGIPEATRIQVLQECGRWHQCVE